MSTVIRANDARDFLGLMPSLLGYTPTESVVLIPFSAGHRSLGAMRIDLPTEDYAPIAGQMIGHVLKVPDTAALVAIVYTSQPGHSTLTMLDALGEAGREVGLDVRDLLYVASDGYGSHTGGIGPLPLSEILPHPAAPAFVAGDQTSAAGDVEVPVEFAAALLDRVGDAFDADPDHLFALAERIATGIVDAYDLATVHWMLERPAVRDILILSWSHGLAMGERALTAQMDWDEGAEYPKELAQVMWGAGERPDAARLEQALANIRVLLAVIPQPGAFATAAWMSWALGRSSVASEFAERGLASDPDHGLCGIVDSMISAGHLPDWAFTRKDAQ